MNKEEYLMLRDEITWRLKAVDSLSTFTYTVCVTILGVALSADIIELLLLPNVVIVPALLKVANHKYSVAYIAAYLNTFLEKYPTKDDFKWEKMHVKYYEINKRTTKEKIIYYGASAEYLLLVIVIACIFWVKYFYQSTRQFTVLQMHGYMFLQIGVILFVAYITISYISFQKTKPEFLENWDRVQRNLGRKRS